MATISSQGLERFSKGEELEYGGRARAHGRTLDQVRL
jgi:hypothetical protein